MPRLARLFDDVDPQADLKAQVRQRREAGTTLETIKAEFGLGLSTVSDWCRDIKVEKETVRGTAAKRRAEKKQLKQQALKMNATGMTPAKIAQKITEFDERTIYRWLGKN